MKKLLLLVSVLLFTQNLFPQVTLLYPNGGENFIAGNVETIRWSGFNVTSVAIESSTDNGVSWLTVTPSTTPDAMYYDWTVPNANSTFCLIRITDVYNPTMVDQSDLPFSIADSYSNPVTLVSPNGGENFIVGTIDTIRWQAASTTIVNLDYSTDNGSTWMSISTNVPSILPSYIWMIPATPSTTCKVRVTDMENGTMVDESDAVFTIQESITRTLTLTSPIGGEVWQANSSQGISWTDSDMASYVNLDYSTDDGASWFRVASNLPSMYPSYQWTIPYTPSTFCKVRVSDASNGSIFDVSERVFTISDVPTNQLTLISPNGGEFYSSGNIDTIRISANYEAFINIDLTTDNGLSWISIATNYALSNPHFIWSVPYATSTMCKIRVSDYTTSAIFDESDQVFTISSNPFAQITVLKPNGRESLIVGTTDTIRWQASSPSILVNIDYSTDGGATWVFVAQQLSSNYPAFSWLIPATPSATCKVRVTDASNALVFDESDMTFTIYEPTLTAGLVAHYDFNGDALDISGNSHNGTVSGSTLLVEDRFHNPNSAYSFYDNSVIKVPHSPQLNFEGQFTFAVWMNLAGGSFAFNCILGKDYTKEFGFGTWGTYCGGPTYPRLIVGNVETSTDTLSPINCFTWTHVTVTFDDAKDEVRFYINGVLTETATNTGSITATATDLGIGEDGFYKDQFYGVLDDIRIYDHVLTSSEISQIYDQSGQIAQALKLEHPNGGENFVVGTIDTIRWTSNYSTNINIDFSTDYGDTWTALYNNVAVNNEYVAWWIPNTPSDKCKVRIVDANNPNVFDESDNFFSIRPLQSGEYVEDANTVLLDHFNNTTIANAFAFSQTGQACGTELPSLNPSLYFGQGLTELFQALTLNPPVDALQGSATYLKYPGGQLLSQVNGTIEFMVNLTSYGKGLGLVQQGQYYGACSGWTFAMDIDSTGTLTSGAWAAFSLNSGMNKVPLNKWTHLAATWGSTGAKLYIDGIQVGSDVNTGMPANGYSGNLLIPLGTGAGISATIDELRVSNIQRTEFNIIPQNILSLSFPNGGENFVAGTIDTIRWSSNYITNVNIEYSTDYGDTWISVHNSLPIETGLVPWLVPNTPSTSCKVRIIDAYNATMFDESDGVFSINSGGGIDSLMYGDKIYHTVKIGNQTWLKENLDIGTMISGTLEQTDNQAIEKYCYDNENINCDTYGGLYQWNEAMQYNSMTGMQGICPAGWHIPDDNEWKELEMYLGLTQAEVDATGWRGTNQGDKLKAISGWNNQNSGTDENGFTALPGGYRYYYNQTFFSLGDKSDFWSASVYDAADNWARRLSFDYSSIYRYHFNNGNGNSVRCIKDETMMATIQIDSPNGGEVFQPYTQVPFEWRAIGVQSFNIEYTTDSGISWTTIENNYVNEVNVYLWNVPGIETDMAKIRISDAYNASLFDESDSAFTITNQIRQQVFLPYEGWNMISFYAQPLSSLPEDVFPSPPILQVKTELKSFDPALPEFLNTLKHVTTEQGYLVKVDSAERHFEMTGMPYYPYDGVNYRMGWNLISYYYSYGEAVWYAFEPIMSSVEEIKSASGYFSPLGSEVTNTLYSLEPGEAYWLKLNTKVDGYILPSPQVVMPKKHMTTGQKLMVELPWKLKGSTQSTVAFFNVTADGRPVSPGSVVAAFINGECRAISEVKLNQEGTSFVTLVINGDKEEEATFKIYDAVKKQAFGSIRTISTKPGTTLQGIQELPFTFITGIEDPILPTSTDLMNAYPNPFNPETRIRYSLNNNQYVSLIVYDILGKEVMKLVNETKEPGFYEVSFNASNLPSGIYFYRMQAGEFVSVKKMLLLK